MLSIDIILEANCLLGITEHLLSTRPYERKPLLNSMHCPNSAQPASHVLRVRTAGTHDAVEKQIDWHPLLTTVSGYSSLLQRLRIVEMVVGTAVTRSVNPIPSWLTDRRSVRDIDADLTCIGEIDCIELPLIDGHQCNWIDSMASGAGAIYVLEGSTLGGQYLARLVKQNLDLDAQRGASYLSGYGTETRLRWKRTQHWLDETLSTEAYIAEAIDSATKTFQFYESILRNSE